MVAFPGKDVWSVPVFKSGDSAPSHLACLNFCQSSMGGQPRPSTHCPFHQPSSFSQQESKVCLDQERCPPFWCGTNLGHL